MVAQDETFSNRNVYIRIIASVCRYRQPIQSISDRLLARGNDVLGWIDAKGGLAFPLRNDEEAHNFAAGRARIKGGRPLWISRQNGRPQKPKCLLLGLALVQTRDVAACIDPEGKAVWKSTPAPTFELKEYRWPVQSAIAHRYARNLPPRSHQNTQVPVVFFASAYVIKAVQLAVKMHCLTWRFPKLRENFTCGGNMSNIPVQKAAEEKALSASWINELNSRSECVGQRAFELFEKYGRPGSNWSIGLRPRNNCSVFLDPNSSILPANSRCALHFLALMPARLR